MWPKSEANDQATADLCGFLQSSLEIVAKRSREWASIVDRVQTHEGRDDASVPDRLREAREYAQFGGALETNRAAFWEVYLWLQLGVELAYFPEQECRDLMNHFKYKELFPAYDSAFQKVGALFPGALQISLVDAFRRNVYFKGANYPHFKKPNALSRAFRGVLMMHVPFFDDPAASDLTAATTFLPKKNWDRVLAKQLDTDTLETQFARESDTDELPRLGPETLTVGFTRFVAYLASLRDWIDDLTSLEESTGEYSLYDLRLFERRCKEICFWRLNVQREDVLPRFRQVSHMVATNIAQRAPADEHSQIDLLVFHAGLQELITFWTRGVVMELSSEAGL